MMPSLGRMYRRSVKSDRSDELINTYLQRPLAGVITYVLAFTSVTPNQVTLISTVFGIIAGCLLALEPPLLPAAGVCAYLKDIFDSADGQLARATGRFSRRGRFWDSIGDYTVNCFIFTGVCLALVHRGMGTAASVLLSSSAWLCVNLRVSYQVFYQTSYLHTHGAYEVNRVTETLRMEDRAEADRVALALQKIFLLLYGWQDRFIAALDARCRAKAGGPDAGSWYTDPAGLRFNALFGMGTEFVALTLCLCAGSIEAYLILTLGVFNLLWASAVLYRFFFALRSSASISK
jgi:phosphatidylglycerophosphate synthase